MHVVSNTPINKKLFNLIIKLSKTYETLILNGNVVNGLYLVKGSSILKNKLQNLKENEIDLDKINLIPNKSFNYDHKKLTNILATNAIKEKDKFKFAGPSYYTNVPTAQVSTAAELVRYFHESWNHTSKEIMCAIVDNKLIEDLPATLTSKLIKKHFPMCNSCPYGNLQKQHLNSNPVFREVDSGEEWEVDIKGE